MLKEMYVNSSVFCDIEMYITCELTFEYRKAKMPLCTWVLYNFTNLFELWVSAFLYPENVNVSHAVFVYKSFPYFSV